MDSSKLSEESTLDSNSDTNRIHWSNYFSLIHWYKRYFFHINYMHNLASNYNSNSWHNWRNITNNLVYPQISSITANTPNPSWALNPASRYTSLITPIPAHSSHNAHHLALPNGEIQEHSQEFNATVSGTSSRLQRQTLANDPGARSALCTPYPDHTPFNPHPVALPNARIPQIQSDLGTSQAPVYGTIPQPRRTALTLDSASESAVCTPHPVHACLNTHALALPNAQLPGPSKPPHAPVYATSPELFTPCPTKPSLNPAPSGFPNAIVPHSYGYSPYSHAPVNGTSSQLQKTPLAFDPRSAISTPYPTQPGRAQYSQAPGNGTSSRLQRPQLALDPASGSSLITPCHAQPSLNTPPLGFPDTHIPPVSCNSKLSHVPVCGTSPRSAHESHDALRIPLAASSNEAESCGSEMRRCIKYVHLSKEGSQDQKKEHKCPKPGCPKVYGKSSHLKAHISRHYGERPYECAWELCGKSFTRSDELQRHNRTHTGERKYECDKCGKRFKRGDHLLKHQKTHLNPRPDMN